MLKLKKLDFENCFPKSIYKLKIGINGMYVEKLQKGKRLRINTRGIFFLIDLPNLR